jgi:hypothetical protein
MNPLSQAQATELQYEQLSCQQMQTMRLLPAGGCVESAFVTGY